jgi:4-alpha-glucanotransferase
VTGEHTPPRRAGVLVPLFSLRGDHDWGCGDIGDVVPFARWAARAGFSLVQLLPVNETTAADPSPYAAASAFALDPVYLSLEDCEDFVAAGGLGALGDEQRRELARVRASERVDWAAVRGLKSAAAHLAFERFVRDEWSARTRRAGELADFQARQRAWLEDSALFSFLHAQQQKAWLDWPQALRDREPDALAEVAARHPLELLERAWLQWQLDLQWRRARAAAADLGVGLMGDLPFVVSTDSADVWARREVFRTDLTVGTPPDAFSATGQDWGLPAYDWDNFERVGSAYQRARAVRAGELYSAYRVDHVIGLYRTFVRKHKDDPGHFFPAEEPAQIALGEALLRLHAGVAEVIAEDLGSVPDFLPPSLTRLGIPGYRVLRWEKDEEIYRDPASWPVVSAATNGTHDTESSAEWYDALPDDEREALAAVPGLERVREHPRFDDAVRDALLATLYAAPSELVLVPFQDALGQRERINKPGTVSPDNWTYRIAATVGQLESDHASVERLHRLAAASGRIPTTR